MKEAWRRFIRDDQSCASLRDRRLAYSMAVGSAKPAGPARTLTTEEIAKLNLKPPRKRNPSHP